MDQYYGEPGVWQDVLVRLGTYPDKNTNGKYGTVRSTSILSRESALIKVGGLFTKASGYRKTSAKIQVLEFNERTVTLSWHDSTSCHYDDQHWRKAKARRIGVCALTGASVPRGADIFKPCKGRLPPANSDAMILVSALTRYCNLDERIPSPE